MVSFAAYAIEYELLFRVQETGNATVEAFIILFRSDFDAQFGTRESEEDPIEEIRLLNIGTQELTIETHIINDVIPEDPLKCFEIRIMNPGISTVTGGAFTCHEDEDVPEPTDFFCIHTICIQDDDG